MKLKRNWWLEIQTLGLVGMVGRSWQMIDMMASSGARNPAGVSIADLPPVTVIVPARNEEKNIERCVSSLLAQDYPFYELIVVNDGSTDATADILTKLAEQNARLKVVTLKEALPPGWAGKPHAMQRGYENVRPESQWILFSDADTVHQPQALRTAVVTALAENAALVSLLPRLELKSFWEKVLMPLAVVGILMQYPLDEVNRPDSKLALANGQFLLVRRDAFEQVGGYGGKLKGTLVDDRDLALAIKGAGGRLLLKDGRDVVAVRMYTSLGEVWSGFRKNAFVGSRAAYLTVPLLVVLGTGAGVLPVVQLFYALLSWLLSGGKKNRKLLAFSFCQSVLLVVAKRKIDRELGVPAPYALSAPLATLIFMGVLVDSMVRSLTGRGLSWKGRTYAGAAKTQQLI